jgi:hypothetical protein
MSDQTFKNDLNSSDFIIESVLLFSSRTIEPIELKNSVSDLEVYEHLNKPYLTASINVVDGQRLFDRFDFQCAENVLISIKRSQASPEYVKTFIIEKIIKSNKVNETTEVLTLHLIEETLFKSNLQNVNKALTGSPYEIIKKISYDYLDKTTKMLGEADYQKDIKVIVPNLHPMEAMTWIKDRATTTEGYPQYLFSSFASPYLFYADLGSILSQPVINENLPYLYSQNATQVAGDQKFFAIQSYTYENVENTNYMISKGVVGAKHTFIDTMGNQVFDVDFNIHDELKNIVESKNSRQSDLNLSDKFLNDGKRLSDYTSRVITNISTNGAYRILDGSYNTYGEERDVGGHKKKVIAMALKHMLAKTPITIQVNGRDYLSGEGSGPKHRSIGAMIKIIFLGNGDAESSNKGVSIDPFKSGDYIIYSIKHRIQANRYDTIMTCVKIANYNLDDYPAGAI